VVFVLILMICIWKCTGAIPIIAHSLTNKMQTANVNANGSVDKKWLCAGRVCITNIILIV
jgi:hypothetical protein